MKSTTRKRLKLSPWFSGVNPLRSRPGKYQCKCCKELLTWNGEYWEEDDGMLIITYITWRGVER